MPSVSTVRRRKAGSAFRDDAQELWQEVKAKGHGVVVGVGG
jgi:phosphoserine phosphatase